MASSRPSSLPAASQKTLLAAGRRSGGIFRGGAAPRALTSGIGCPKAQHRSQSIANPLECRVRPAGRRAAAPGPSVIEDFTTRRFERTPEKAANCVDWAPLRSKRPVCRELPERSSAVLLDCYEKVLSGRRYMMTSPGSDERFSTQSIRH